MGGSLQNWLETVDGSTSDGGCPSELVCFVCASVLGRISHHQVSHKEQELDEQDKDKAYHTQTEHPATTALQDALHEQTKDKESHPSYQRTSHAHFTLRRLNGNTPLPRDAEKQVSHPDPSKARAYFERRYPAIFSITNPHSRRNYINALLWKRHQPNYRRDVMRLVNTSYFLQGKRRLPWMLNTSQFNELLACFCHASDLYDKHVELYTRVMGQHPRQPEASSKLASRLRKVVTLNFLFKRFAELLGYHAFASMIPVTKNDSSRRRHLKFWHLTCRLLGLPFHVHSFHQTTHPNYE